MIALHGLGKRFKLYDRPMDRLVEWIGLADRSREFWALRDLEAYVPDGSSLGIIGANGAGKSTLLKLITGTLMPTTGTIQVEGRVAALLELGTGFHSDFTGRQNIWINGQLLGLDADEIRRQEAEIIAFSELGDFIDQPLRTYSSGMVVRLGFSVAAAVNPQILIIDEALSVGDARFSQKCIKRIKAFREQGTTLLFVSHDPNAVSTLCDECLLLNEGRIVDHGKPQDVLEHYGALIAKKGTENSAMQIKRFAPQQGVGTLHSKATKSGTFQAIITDIELKDHTGKETSMFLSEGVLNISISALILKDIHQPTFGILIRDHLGTDMFGTNTVNQQIDLGACKAGEKIMFNISVPMMMGEGDYSIACALHKDETHLEECFDWTDRAAVFSVRPAGRRKAIGRVLLNSTWNIEKQKPSLTDFQDILQHYFSNITNPLPLGAATPSPFLSGFYQPEYLISGDPYRWIEKQGTCLFRAEHSLLYLCGFFPPNLPACKIKLMLNQDQELGVFEGSEIVKGMTFTLPDSAQGRINQLTLICEETFVEEETSISTVRELGFALVELKTQTEHV